MGLYIKDFSTISQKLSIFLPNPKSEKQNTKNEKAKCDARKSEQRKSEKRFKINAKNEKTKKRKCDLKKNMRNEINPITLKTKISNHNALKKTTINYTKLLRMPTKRALFL